MALKDQMARDLHQVFVRTNEFADTATINGVQVPVVWDNEGLSFKIRTDFQGLTVGDALLFVAQEDWERVPRVHRPPRAGDAILVDGRPATLSLVQCDQGLYELTLAYAGGKP